MSSLLNFEIKRKLFHLFAVIFPITYLFIDKNNMLIILLFLSAIGLCLDISKSYSTKIKGVLSFFFQSVMRKEEDIGEVKLTGLSYMALGLSLSCLLFPKGLAINCWLVLIVSDAVAAIIGIAFGKKLANGKSLAGSVSFLVSTIVISLAVYFFIGYPTSFVGILISSVVTTIIEFLSKDLHIDDNLSIPLTYGVTSYLCLLFM